MASRVEDFKEELSEYRSKPINQVSTFYLGVIARQLCELTDILIEYKEGKNNDNK